MSPKTIGLSQELYDYSLGCASPLDDVQQRLIERTRGLGGLARMQISPDQGALLGMLVATVAPALAVEIGTFTGYSALVMARGLPDGGRLLSCDVSEEWTAIAREHWDAAGVADRIDLRIGPAIDTLRCLPSDQPVGFAFIDADKTGYVDYYEELLPRLEPHGLIAVDNTLWSGAVIDPSDTSDDTEAIRRFNAHVATDPRTDSVIVPIGDGMTLIRSR